MDIFDINKTTFCKIKNSDIGNNKMRKTKINKNIKKYITLIKNFKYAVLINKIMVKYNAQIEKLTIYCPKMVSRKNNYQ